MTKRIFTNTNPILSDTQNIQPKRQFNEDQVEITEDTEILEGEVLDEQFNVIANPRPKLWKKCVIFIIILFAIASLGQSIQWLWDSYQQHQWIYFAFALVSLGIVGLGLSALWNEWRKLKKLRQHQINQQRGSRFLGLSENQSAVPNSGVFTENHQRNASPEMDSEQAKNFCLTLAKTMSIDEQNLALQQWQSQINEAHSSQEIAFLFSQTVLKNADKQAKNLVTKAVLEAGTIVAISPLAVVDIFFVAWRNIRLINRIADIYGMELGYFSRLRLMKLVLMNMAFAGATEILADQGMDFLSQDFTAKLSARAAQGIGVGLLTARLGIKAIEFCRPLPFLKEEKPKLKHIQRGLLAHLKSHFFSRSSHQEENKETVKV